MDIIALAGGYGTRLGELTVNKPKALLDLNGTPLLTYTLARLNKLEGVGTIYVVSNEKFYGQLVEWSKSVNSRYPIKVLNDGTTSNENRLGAIGDLQFALETENIKDKVLLLGTDNFFTFDLNHVVLRSAEVDGSVAGFYDVQDKELAKMYGIGTVDEDGKVIDFVEKPEQPQSTLSLMMLWCLHPKDFPLVKKCVDEGKADRAGDFVKYLMEKSTVHAVVYDKPFYDIGSPKVYEELNESLRKSM